MSDDHDRVSRSCPLTPREREVLAWAARGKSASAISTILHIAKRTVDEHAGSACRKLGAANRVHAVAIALHDRFIDLEGSCDAACGTAAARTRERGRA